MDLSSKIPQIAGVIAAFSPLSLPICDAEETKSASIAVGNDTTLSQETLLRQISLSLLEYSDIPPEHLSDAKVIAALLRSERTQPEAFAAITISNLKSPEVLEAFFSSSLKLSAKSDGGNLTQAFSDPEVCAHFNSWLNENPGLKPEDLRNLLFKLEGAAFDMLRPEIETYCGSAIIKPVPAQGEETARSQVQDYTSGVFQDTAGREESELAKIKDVANSIRLDFTNLRNVNPYYSGFSEVRHAIRLGMHQRMIAGGDNFSFDEKVKILSNHFAHVPELSSLISGEDFASHYIEMTKEGREFNNFPPARIVLYNPSFNSWYPRSAPFIGEEYVQSLLKVTQASEILGLKGINRFDNAFEIIRNRYLVSSDATREKLEQILGKEYFESVKRDSRPICVVLFPEATNDYNGAFRTVGSQGWDIVDKLTSAQQVFYFETGHDYQAIGSILQTYRKLGEKISLVFFGGHGSDESISLGENSEFHFDFSRDLDKDDGEIISEAKVACADNVVFILGSCHTANVFALALQAEISNATVYAPDDAASVIMEFHENGRWKDITFPGANRIILEPKSVP